MVSLCDLHSAAIIEKDTHGDVLWVWSYPTVSEEQRQILLRSCCLENSSEERPQVTQGFVYSQYDSLWYYIYTTEAGNTALKKVAHFSLALTAKDFNPEKYNSLCAILAKLYKRTASPAAMLESYLSVVTRGVCNGEENGQFALKDFDARQAYVAASVKDVINKFQIESIIILTALLLKKRVVVYHSAAEELLKVVRAFPALVWHRQNWNILYPYVNLIPLDIQNLRKASHYVAGFTDASVEHRSDLYDVFVNAVEGEISIAPHAKDTFSMGKLHKDLATTVVQSAQDEAKSDQQVIKEIALKIKELLGNLRGLATAGEDGGRYVTVACLKARKMQAVTENFLLGLAAAEGFLKT